MHPRDFAKKQYLQLAASLAVFFYAVRCMADKDGWHLIDNVDLIFHEAGHAIFWPLGWTMSVAGGSLLQMLVPLALFAVFFRGRQLFSAAVMLYWAAISTASVAVYAGDAVLRRLPLITGDAEGHDWNNLLSHFGLLRQTKLIAGIIFGAAVVFLCAGLALSLYAAFFKEDPETSA